MSMNLIERDAVLTAGRMFRIAAEAGVQEVSGTPPSRLVLDSLSWSKVTETRSPCRSSCRRKGRMQLPEFDGHGQLRLWLSKINFLDGTPFDRGD